MPGLGHNDITAGPTNWVFYTVVRGLIYVAVASQHWRALADEALALEVAHP
jgi:hypothetical protein